MHETGIYLFKKKGYYYISFTDENGHRRQKSTRCKFKSDAVKVLSNFSAFIADGRKDKPVAISAFIKDFILFAKTNFASHTVYLYEKTLENFVRICGDIAMGKITPKHFDTYKVTRLNEGVQARLGRNELERKLSPITVNIELRTLRAALNTAVRWQTIPKNPFEKLSLISIPRRTPAYLTAQDADTLLSVITKPWLRDFVIVALNTGMRRGELLSLRWVDVDVVARVARITNRADFTSKSGEERNIYLNEAALMAVNRCKVSPLHEYIFSDELGIRLTPDRVTKAFKKAVRASGLPEGIHVHSCRHSFASILISGGTSLFVVSQLLGHSNAKISEIYSHLLPHHKQDEVDKINIGLFPNSPAKN